MDFKGIVEGLIAIATPLAALIGIGGRRHRLRAEVQDNLALLESVKKDDLLVEHTPAVGWLSGRIALDIARLAGQPLGGRKKPIPWSSVVVAAFLALAFGGWTYLIVHDGFVWYSVFPGTAALIFVFSVLGLVSNRQIPNDPELPEGATPVRSDTAEEQVAGGVQLAASGAAPEMYDDDGQVGVALRFVGLMRNGRYEEALGLADSNWNLCRIQSRLWNMHRAGNLEREVLPELADSLHRSREPGPFWEGYVKAEAHQFTEAWRRFDPAKLGAASRRRRMSRDYDLVILVPLGPSGGFFVTSATLLPNALPILMHRVDGKWLVANHIGHAPPMPGWPPAWWNPADPAFESLPED